MLEILLLFPPIYCFIAALICFDGRAELRALPTVKHPRLFIAVKIMQNVFIFLSACQLCMKIGAGMETAPGILFTAIFSALAYIWLSPLGIFTSLFFLPQIKREVGGSYAFLYFIASSIPIFDVLFLAKIIRRNDPVSADAFSNNIHIFLVGLVFALLPYTAIISNAYYYQGLDFSAKAMLISIILLIPCAAIFTPKKPVSPSLYIMTISMLAFATVSYAYSLLDGNNIISHLREWKNFYAQNKVQSPDSCCFILLKVFIMHLAAYAAYLIYCVIFVIKGSSAFVFNKSDRE